MAFDLRLATEADRMALLDLRLEGLRQNPEAFGESYERVLALPPEAFLIPVEPSGRLVAESDGQFVGMLLFIRHEYKAAHRASIFGVYVRPEFRRRGIAGALLDDALARLRAQSGVERVGISVSTGCPAARALYESRGFVYWGTEPAALKVGDTLYDEDYLSLAL